MSTLFPEDNEAFDNIIREMEEKMKSDTKASQSAVQENSEYWNKIGMYDRITSVERMDDGKVRIHFVESEEARTVCIDGDSFQDALRQVIDFIDKQESQCQESKYTPHTEFRFSSSNGDSVVCQYGRLEHLIYRLQKELDRYNGRNSKRIANLREVPVGKSVQLWGYSNGYSEELKVYEVQGIAIQSGGDQAILSPSTKVWVDKES